MEIEGEAWGENLCCRRYPRDRRRPRRHFQVEVIFLFEFVIASTDEPKQLVEFVNQLVGAAFQSGKFMFADADLKFDQPQSRVEIERDKVALGA